MANEFAGAVVSNQALKSYKGPGRVAPEPELITNGIEEGRVAVPEFLVNVYYKFIGKKKEKKTAGSFPEEGGKMAYRSGPVSRLGTKVYEKLIKLAADREFNVCEMPYHTLQEEFPSYEPIQGYERPGRYDHEIGIMSRDKDGSIVSDWKKARILAHEIAGAMYTRAGKSHEANHPAIEVNAKNLLAELAAA